MRRERTRGGAFVYVLTILVGILLGALAIFGCRHFKLDLWPHAAELVGLEWREPEPEKAPPGNPVLERHTPEELKAMIEELKNSKSRLEKDEQDLALKRRMLKQEQEQLVTLKTRIEESKRRLDAQFLASDEYEKKNTERLAKMWATLEPDEAATLARQLSDGFTARILYSMKEKVAAPIVAAIAAGGGDGPRQAATILQMMKQLRERNETVAAQ